jgi:hypothetical protein
MTAQKILAPLKRQTEHLERLHALDPENELHEHTAALFRFVYNECLARARERGYELEGAVPSQVVVTCREDGLSKVEVLT